MTRRDFIKTAGIAAAMPGLLESVASPQNLNASEHRDVFGDLSPLAGTHDLRLPDWGPYTTTYNGLSHVADKTLGMRFDLSVFPGFYRRGVLIPNVSWEAGFHPWEAASDLSYFSYRYELEWKDLVYCDISFSEISPRSRLVRAEFVNRTPVTHNLMLHYVASLNYPPVRPYSSEALQRGLVQLPPGAIWIDALDFVELQHARPWPSDSLVPDGKRRGEIRDHQFVNGSGIGARFGLEAGDRVRFKVRLQESLKDGLLLVRYRNKSKRVPVFNLEGAVSGELVFAPSDELALVRMPIGPLSAGEHELRLVSKGKGSCDLDGFVLVESGMADGVKFATAPLNFTPQILDGPVPNSRLLKYPDCAQHYGIAWRYDIFQVRQFRNSEIDRYMRRAVLDQLRSDFIGDGKWHFTNAFLRPIPLAPQSTRIIYGLAAVGSQDEVNAELRAIASSEQELESHYQQKRTTKIPCTPAGEAYSFSQQRMATTTMTNVVFPIYGKRKYFRHYSPGKWWDSLYSWDSGFIALGLSELDVHRSVDCLNAYMTEPGDAENAFIQHGTPIPVQHYAFLELWNRTRSRALLEHFYPRLRQYHNFLAGRLGTSTTRSFKSGLLKTWDYFYNTGWDDYPPQVHIHEKKVVQQYGTAIMNSHLIRTARLLARVARTLGRTEDVADYEQDIVTWSAALQKHCWDPNAGYYSYVRHSENGEAVDILRHDSGQNFNMGQDGVMPLLAGDVCTPEQVRRLLEHMQSPKELWTPIGLSTVDQSARYYRIDGYWNGAVWMPHQWFLWKALLDYGESDFAFKVAQTALDVWKAEVDESYHCFEHFLIESGRGAGWHQFSALSTPVMLWFGVYYRPGRLTTGYDAWLSRCEFADGNKSLLAELDLTGRKGGTSTVLATMRPGFKYKAKWNGADVFVAVAGSGTLQMNLASDAGKGTLTVAPV